MPRIARSLVLFDAPYHIVSRGNSGSHVFHSKSDFAYFSKIVQETKVLFEFKLYHYAFLNNHIHIMIHAKNPEDFCPIMRRVKHHYSMYHKKKYHESRQMHLWGDRYASIEIRNDEQLLVCGIYIELNPVRAGICENPEQYEWSSYRYYCFGTQNQLIDEDPCYQALGNSTEERQRKYQELTIMWQSMPRPQKLSTDGDCH
ncbi:MAG: transposase [bacterium]